MLVADVEVEVEKKRMALRTPFRRCRPLSAQREHKKTKNEGGEVTAW